MSDARTATSRLERAVSAGAEALFAACRDDGVFAPSEERFSPANTAAVLIALHTAREPRVADGPDGAGGSGRADALRVRAVERLLATQRPDGGWAMDGVPTETLTTAVVAAALTLAVGEAEEGGAAGAPPEEVRAAVDAARALVRRRGGEDGLPEPAMAGLVRQFASLARERDPATLPRLPLELLLLPGPARRALSLRLPIFSAMALAQSVERGRRGGHRVRALLDSALRPRALRIVRDAFERERSTGSFSGDPWLTGLVTIGIARSELAPDITRAAAGRLSDVALPDGGWELMPLDITWSSFAAAALLEAGYADDPRLAPVRGMFRRRQQDVPFAALDCPAGFWGFSGDRGWPMALETAEVTALLHRMPGGGGDTAEGDGHVRRGLDWLTAMQDRAGTWGLAVRDSRPGGFGPCPQMTAKCVVALLDCGAGREDPRVRKGVEALVRAQRSDGALEAMWYRGLTPGTAAALVAFTRAGRGDGEPARRARDFLLRTQLPDGSWGPGGHDPGAVTDGASGGGEGAEETVGTVEETAWALHALLVAGEAPDSAAPASAADWLLDRRRDDGTWPAAAVHEYVRHCYRYTDPVLSTALAVKALGRLRTAGGPPHTKRNGERNEERAAESSGEAGRA